MVVVADFNGDGKPDLAVLNTGSANVSILLGKGDGTFQPARDFNVSSTATYLAVGDLNGDRKPDLVVADGSANTVSILLGNGDGTFKSAVQYNTDISAEFVAVADFNNDKKSDVLVSATPVGPLYQGSISILLGNGNGTLQSPKVTPITAYTGTTAFVAIADFNGDGKLDVATGNGTFNGRVQHGNVIVLPGNGDGTFRSPVASAVGFQPVYMTTGDLNIDGKADLVAVERVDHLGGLTGFAVYFSEAVQTLLGNGDGTFRVSQTAILPFELSKLFPPPQNPYAPNVVVADLNDDGKPDLILPVVVPNPSIVGGQHTAIWTFLGNGDGTFQNPQKFTLATVPSWLAVGNFNRDSLPDIAVSNYSANDVGVILNTTP